MNKLSLALLVLLSTQALAVNTAPVVMQQDQLKLGNTQNTATDKTIEFVKGTNSSTNPKVKWNGSTSKLQFTNDGTNFKDLGSGSGGGGGQNYITNGDIESQLTGWTFYNDRSIISSVASNVLTTGSAHGLQVGEPVVFVTSSTLPGGTAASTIYYVITVPSTTTFSVSSTLGGSTLTVSSAGSGASVTPLWPSDGTGGTNGQTWTASSTIPLSGTYSLLYQKGANSSNESGQGASFAFTVDNKDVGKMLQVSFDYYLSANAANYLSSNGVASLTDLTVWAYDVNNSTLIPVVGSNIASSTLKSRYLGSFQTAVNSGNYRIILHNSNTGGTSAWNMQLDNISVGPSTQSYGAIIGDWQTCTATGSWTSNSTYLCQYRRVGDSAEVLQRVALTGAPNAVGLTFTLPFTANTTVFSGARTFGQMVGSTGGNSTSIVGHATINSASPTLISPQWAISNGAFGNPVNYSGINATSPGTYASGDFVEIKYTYPVSGWSSGNIVMSQDTDQRVVAFKANNPYTASVNTGLSVYMDYLTIVTDTHGAWSPGVSYNNGTGTWASNPKYNCPVSGQYEVSASMAHSVNGTGYRQMNVYRSGSNMGMLAQQAGNASNGLLMGGSMIVQCNAGEWLGVATFQNSGSTLSVTGTQDYGQISIKRISGGAQAIAASESVSALYINNASTGLSNSIAPMPFATKMKDTHSAWNGTDGFTAPMPGWYIVHVKHRTTANSFSTTQGCGSTLYKNGASYLRMGGFYGNGGGNNWEWSGTTGIQLAAGDVVKDYVICDVAANLSGSGAENYIHIFRQGQ